MAILCVVLSIVCFYDYRRRKIPNFWILFILLIGLCRGIVLDSLWGAGGYLLKLVVVLLLFYPIFRIGGIGAGDVKLFSVCAGFFPADKIFSFLFVSMLISAFFSIVKLYRERNVRDRVSYFVEYCMDVFRSGNWGLYLPQKNNRRMSGICMSGPILMAVLLQIGGIV